MDPEQRQELRERMVSLIETSSEAASHDIDAGPIVVAALGLILEALLQSNIYDDPNQNY